MDIRPAAGPLVSSKRIPDNDSKYIYRNKGQCDFPAPGKTARDTPLGNLTIVQLPKDNRMELRVEYPRPYDKPQVGNSQDIKGTWKYDTSWFAGWKFTREKTPNMRMGCVGILIDSEVDESFVGNSRSAWFLRREANNSDWSVKVFPPWEDHTIPSLNSHEAGAKKNRLQMMSSHEFYCREFGTTMIDRKNPVPPGVPEQRENSNITRLLPARSP
jgi:hypothetical protein